MDLGGGGGGGEGGALAVEEAEFVGGGVDGPRIVGSEGGLGGGGEGGEGDGRPRRRGGGWIGGLRGHGACCW